ncbi:MAG: hypothetical protein ABL907_03790 [Hyphomicrobium sp.]
MQATKRVRGAGIRKAGEFTFHSRPKEEARTSTIFSSLKEVKPSKEPSKPPLLSFPIGRCNRTLHAALQISSLSLCDGFGRNVSRLESST